MSLGRQLSSIWSILSHLSMFVNLSRVISLLGLFITFLMIPAFLALNCRRLTSIFMTLSLTLKKMRSFSSDNVKCMRGDGYFSTVCSSWKSSSMSVYVRVPSVIALFSMSIMQSVDRTIFSILLFFALPEAISLCALRK